MMLAPQVPLSGQLVHYGDGVAGVVQTMQVMRSLVDAYKTDLAIRSAAVSAVYLIPARDEQHEVEALFNFVRDSIRYVRDVCDVEMICTPDVILASKVGDCDDKSLLLATLYESVGYPTQFVVVGFSAPRMFEHIYLQVFADGEWVSCDATEPEPFGWAPPDPVAYMTEKGY